MQLIIRITLGLVLVCGLSEVYRRFDNAAEATYRSVFDASTYPAHPPGKQWKDLPYEYRKQYTLWFRDELHRRFDRAFVLGLLSVSAAMGMQGVLIWMVYDLVKQRLVAGLTATPLFSETLQPQQVPSCDTAVQS